VKPEPFPDLDWDPKRARDFGEQAVDLWTELLERLRQLPIRRRESREAVRDAVLRPVPEEPLPVDELVEYLREVVLEHSMYPGHPGFMAYVSGAGTVPGAAADLLAAAVNQNVGGWRLSPAATEIEQNLTRWLATEMGLPEGSGGLFTSGGAMANFIGLKVARDRALGPRAREDGVRGAPPMRIYASEDVHDTNDRAADMLGLGHGSVRHIPTDDRYRVRVDALRSAIAEDRAAGIRPIAVIAVAGTTATGAIDPLEEIADICAERGLWFHIDGAYGAPAAMVPDLRPQFAGIERADSIAIDPHKWLYTPHSGGCILMRDMEQLHDAFRLHPSYTREDKSIAGTGEDLMEFGPQFSRGFQGLKVWVSLLAHGRAAYVRRIGHDVELARYLHRCVEERPEFEPMAPTVLSIACFRYVPSDLPGGSGRDEYLDALNERLMIELQLDGRVFPSNAVLRGRFALRACIVNFRTEAEEMDLLLDAAAELGTRLDRELRPSALRA
jgi:glutamate/tyrosine decarboxylase-like PLP-dependent enzyme